MTRPEHRHLAYSSECATAVESAAMTRPEHRHVTHNSEHSTTVESEVEQLEQQTSQLALHGGEEYSETAAAGGHPIGMRARVEGCN